MVNTNKKVTLLLATALFLTPSFTIASNMEINDTKLFIPNDNVNEGTGFLNRSGSGILNQYKIDKKQYKTDKSDIKQKYIEEKLENKEDYKSQKQEIIKKSEMKNPTKDFKLSDEQLINLEKLKSELESDLKTLRESLTTTNIDDIKIKAEQLKKDYILKIKSISEDQDLIKIVENRFEVFYKNQFENKEAIKKLNENFKEKSSELKENFKGAKQELREKYKEAISKKYINTLSEYSIDKLKIISDRLNIRKDKILSDTKIIESKKEIFIAQIEGLLLLINQIIEEKDNELNLDDIIN